MPRHTLAVLTAIAIAAPALADLKLAPLFTDHMVLQQQSACPVWGWERPGAKVTVRASWGATAEATADENGRWRANLQTPTAGGPFELAIAGDTGVTLRDVWVGEVWLASGQSNMEWPLSATDRAQADIAAADASYIRFFGVPNTISLHPRLDIDAAWTPITPQSAPGVSAVAYHFAREISGANSGRLGMPMPIGIIQSDWGGTRIEAWMDAASLAAFPEYAGDLETVEMLKDPVRRAPLMEDAAKLWWDRLDTLPGQPGNAWTSLEFNDTSWGTTPLPATWDGDLANFDGIVRYRRTVELPASWGGKAGVIELGPIDDRDDVWINGTYIGGTRTDGAWQVARRYEVPAGVLRAGANVVCVRAYDTGGIGGINGKPEQMRLSLAGTQRAGEGFSARPLAGDWRFLRGSSTAQLPAQTQAVSINANTLTALYNAMIHPLIPFRVRGVIWYQGESNRNNAARYADLMRAWIALWRKNFESPDMPFYWVQIAPYGYPNDRGQTVALREAQQRATDVPNTGIVITTDIGDNADIHPRNKRDVGRRLALLARRGVYGERDLIASGPRFNGTRPSAGGDLAVAFAAADDGLTLTPGPGGLTGFEIAGDDRRFYAAEASVRGASVIVRSPRVARPVAVRFNWTRSPEANLANAQGLPAAPFRSDDWSAESVTRDEESFLAPLRTQEQSFRSLFNGSDLSGWTFVNSREKTWSVASDADGAYIRCTGIPTGVMRTARQYENFVLEMEYRHLVPSGNAGLFVWSDPLPVRGAPFTRSVEVQVMDGQEGNGFTSDGDIFPIWGATMTPENGRQGSSRAFPTERRSNPAPMWNHYRVECVNGAITLWLNGKVVTRGREVSPRRGYICLESEGTEVHFRNIRIKELPAATPSLAPAQIASSDEGFRPLYNGVDLEGWDVQPAHEGHWVPSDWRLAFDGQGDHLWSKESFGDFQLICDWRWTGTPVETARPVILADGSVQLDAAGQQVTTKVMDAGDSGIYLRGSDKSQVNMWCWPIGSGEVYGYRNDASMPAAVRAGVTPRVVADQPIGQWNRFVITMKGDRLTVVLNGQTVIENAQLPGVAAEGPIALQMHGNPIEFANIYVKRLD